jgi:ATP-dependent RNA helicase DeaD
MKKTFASFNLSPEIQKNLDLLGFTQPTEIQEKIIPFLLAHDRDVHAQAQTGTGKTLAFGIPLLHKIDKSSKNVQGLIIAPTRELVMQIYESLRDVARNTGIRIEPIYGGMPIERQISNIKQGAQILVGTPGRLNDHLRRKTFSLKNLKILVLDEADIMLDMGFREEIDEILDQARGKQIWLFSATVMPGIKKLIQSHMHNVYSVKAEKKEVVSGQVKQYYAIMPKRQQSEALIRFIEAAPEFYGIVFCRTKLLATELMELLASRGLPVNSLHGDMSQALRNKVIKGFKSKDFTILIATDLAARGIDVSDLTHVINFSIPDDYESYIHRIGRTGRAGKEGIAITFAAPSELMRIKRLERAIKVTLQQLSIPTLSAIVNAKIEAVSDFIEQSKKPCKELSSAHEPLKKLIDSFSEEEIRNAFLISLEDKFFKDMMHEDLSHVQFKASGIIPEEICIELGKDAGLSEDSVRDYLYRTCKLLPKEVYKARVLDRKTFISIPDNRLQECLKEMRAQPISDVQHSIHLVKDERRSSAPRKKGKRMGKDKSRRKR